MKKRCRFSGHKVNIDGDLGEHPGKGGLWSVSSTDECGVSGIYCKGFEEDAIDCPTWSGKKRETFMSKSEFNSNNNRCIEKRKLQSDATSVEQNYNTCGNCSECTIHLYAKYPCYACKWDASRAFFGDNCDLGLWPYSQNKYDDRQDKDGNCNHFELKQGCGHKSIAKKKIVFLWGFLPTIRTFVACERNEDKEYQWIMVEK